MKRRSRADWKNRSGEGFTSNGSALGGPRRRGGGGRRRRRLRREKLVSCSQRCGVEAAWIEEDEPYAIQIYRARGQAESGRNSAVWGTPERTQWGFPTWIGPAPRTFDLFFCLRQTRHSRDRIGPGLTSVQGAVQIIVKLNFIKF